MGSAWDSYANAQRERFSATSECELVSRRPLQTREEANWAAKEPTTVGARCAVRSKGHRVTRGAPREDWRIGCHALRSPPDRGRPMITELFLLLFPDLRLKVSLGHGFQLL